MEKKYKRKFIEMALICQDKNIRVEVRSKESGNEPHFCCIVDKEIEINISILNAKYTHPEEPRYKLNKKEKSTLDSLLRKSNKILTNESNFNVIRFSWDSINHKYAIKQKNIKQPDYNKLD